MFSKLLYLLLIALISLVKFGGTATCPDAWIPYNDEYCVQTYSDQTLQGYTEAMTFCNAQAPANLLPSLLLIKDDEYQNFVAETVYASPDVFDSIWIGAYFSNTTETFLWEDGDELSYSNWATGYPREDVGPGRCIEMQSPHTREARTGQWIDVACGKRNMVVCQTSTTWTLEETVLEVKKLRKQVAALEASMPNATDLQDEVDWKL